MTCRSEQTHHSPAVAPHWALVVEAAMCPPQRHAWSQRVRGPTDSRRDRVCSYRWHFGRCRVSEPCQGSLRFAFHGRVSTEDYQGPATSRAQQLDGVGGAQQVARHPLAGSRYGSPAAWLTRGSGTGPVPAAHRWTAARPLPRRTAPGPPLLAPGPRPAPRPAPPRPRAASRRHLQRFVLLDRHKYPSALRRAPKPAATQLMPVAALVLAIWHSCTPTGLSEEIRLSVAADAR